MNTTMNTPATKTNLAAKSALARLMAAEDITVEISPAAATASFDLEQRRLTLPVWDVEGDAYDMLVGHEVSHALYSPQTGKELLDACTVVAPKNPSVGKDFINIVEDARIERMIKVDYPGLRKSFAAGYRTLLEKNLFGTNGKDISTLSLIDRTNLQYKIGWLVEVPFSAEELPLVQRVATTRTWDEVVALSKELYEFAKEQANDKKYEDEEKGEGSDKGKKGEQDNDENKKSDDAGGDETEETADGNDADGNDQGDDADGNDQGDDAEGDDAEDDADGTGKGDDEDGTTDSADDDTDDGESADSTTDENQTSKPSDGATSGEELIEPEAPTTSKTLQDNLDKLVKQSNGKIVYADLPTLPENFVVPFTRVEQAYTDTLNNIKQHGGGEAMAARVFTTWKTKNNSDVLALATEFERRKAADSHKRTVTADTGALDPSRLFSYKTSEDIFLRSSTVLDGKNHGLVLLLDMSGSMSNQMLDTMIQLVNLTAFARRVSIPFKVYGFTDYDGAMTEGNALWGTKNPQHWVTVNTNNETGTPGTKTRLLTLIESGTTQLRYQKAVATLLTYGASLAASYGNNSSNEYVKAMRGGEMGGGSVYSKFTDQGFALNGTPTNEALMGLLHLVPAFKKKHNVQVVNTIILTDGQAGDAPLCTKQYGYSDPAGQTVTVVRDPQTRREYNVWTESTYGGKVFKNNFNSTEQQALLVKMLKDRTGAKVININLVVGGRKHLYPIMTALGGEHAPAYLAAKKHWGKEGWVGIKSSNGFDEEIFLNTANAQEVDFDFNSVTVDASSKKGEKELQKAFVKSLASRKANRPLMARIATLISTNL